MSAPAVVTILLAVVASLTIVAFLIAIALVLKEVNSRLAAVVGAVVAIVDKTEPVGPVVMSIDRNLTAAREVLESLLKRKLGAVPPPVGSTSAPGPARRDPATRAEPVTQSEPAAAPFEPAAAEPAPAPPSEPPLPTTAAAGTRGTPGMPASAEPPDQGGGPAPGMPATAEVPGEDDGGTRPGLTRTLRGRLPGGARERAVRHAPGTPVPRPTRVSYERGPSSFGFEDEPAGTDWGDGASG